MIVKTNLFVHSIGFALSITSGIIYTFCYIGVTLWPRQFMNILTDWVHSIDFSQISIQPTFSLVAFVRGLLEIMIFAYLTGIIFAAVYDMCVSHCKKIGWIK